MGVDRDTAGSGREGGVCRGRGLHRRNVTVAAGLALALCLVLCLVLCLMLGGCGGAGARRLKRYSAQYFDLFDTVTVFTAYTADQDEFDHYAGEMYAEMAEFHRLFDIYHDYEGVNTIKTINNNAGISPVRVDGRIIGLLEEAVNLYELTGGAVNVAMGSVLSIWHEYREAALADPDQAQVPPMELLEEAAAHTDITKLRIDRQAGTVYLDDPEMSLDVGAVAKGYATEMVSRKLREDGLTSAMLNVGGNVRTIGAKPAGGWPAVAGVGDEPAVTGVDSEPAVTETDGEPASTGGSGELTVAGAGGEPAATGVGSEPAVAGAGSQSAVTGVGGESASTGGGGEPWAVGIQNPDTGSGEAYLHSVNLIDASLVTSGTYQRYYEVDGVRYHHIIHPDLLMPWDRYESVTILCGDSGLADGLSTAVFNMEIEDGLGLIEGMDGVEALWIYPDKTEVRSSGFAGYERS